jgi:peptidoglycan-associated lipoprotein
MKKSTTIQACLWGLCAILATGCQKKSGNIWEDNQTGGQYIKKNTSALWDTITGKGDGLAGPIEEQFVPLNEDDLKTQFAESPIVPQPSRDLGEGGVPRAEQFDSPKGDLASVFRPVFFNTDEFTVKNKDYMESIHRMAAYLKTHPNTYVIIEGHCDERGPEAYNLSLGTRRANHIRSLLIKEGVHPDQLHTISYGKERPFAMEHGPDAWAQNRRAHFRVHNKQTSR